MEERINGIEKPVILDRKEPIPGEYGHPVPRELMLRELGYSGQFGRHSVGKRVVSQTFSTKAVHTMSTQEEFKKRSFKLPSGARTTFHMAFSADGTKVASCHGDHNVYVCEVGSGKVVQTLTGHPRTPWCVVFHPTQNDVLASGCLAGHVRVWDLKGGSETLITDSGTVIASLAFHPLVRLLAIATFNEIIFWDWGVPYPLARCSTENTKEKVRLVRFDRLGRSLITGITNYPNAPFRESCRVQGSAFFRPNILSRGSSRRAPRPVPFQGDAIHNAEADDDDNDPTDGRGPGSEESMPLVRPPPDVSDTLNDRQERFQESYRQLVNHYQDLVNHYQQFLRNRIPRLLETSRVVHELPHISPPMPLQPTDFIPVVALSNEASLESSPDVSNDAVPTINVIPSDSLGLEDPEYPVVGSLEQLPNSIVIDQETAGPSRLIQLENTLMDHMETEAATTLVNLPNMMAASPVSLPQDFNSQVPPTNINSTNPPRSDTDLQSIEALAQNILEMQNLCTQARRDAPVTVETQHIIELQNIRQHLELLQEQTRDLQSSIRATLSSLAHGSFDALRSHIVSNANASQPAPLLPQPAPVSAGPPSLSAVDVAADSQTSASSSDLDTVDMAPEPNQPPAGVHQTPGPGLRRPPTINPEAIRLFQARAQHIVNERAIAEMERHGVGPSSDNPTNNPIIRITISPHITTANNPVELGRLSPPGPYVYSNSPPPTTRSRVPPIVTMQYDFGDGMYRSRTTTLNPGINMEPQPGPSREITGTSTTYQVARSTIDPITGNRRVVREFHVMGRPGPGGDSEHARNCPFSRDGNLARPPPRMRCLAEMGETPVLSVWPTADTGQEQATRSFRGLRRDPIAESERNQPTSGATNQSGRTGQGSATNATSAEAAPLYHMHQLYSSSHLPSFSHWMNAGPNWVNSNLGVAVYLTVRQHNESLHLEEDLQQQQRVSENWQRFFISGLSLVPPSVRQGQRHHSRRQRRTPNIIYHMGSGSSRAIPLRPSSWDEFRSNLYASSSPTEQTSLGSNPIGSNPIQDVPARFEGNFTRIYNMRMGDEIIPVYAHWAALTPMPNGGIDLRDSPQSNVYTFPIGLFLNGDTWTGGVQSLGIFWPPASRDEEDTLIEMRRNETLVPVLTQEEMEVRLLENPSNVFYRVDYDTSQLTIYVSDQFRLTMIQPGLSLLDAVTAMVNWQRPRPVAGTIYLNMLAPFYDALDRLFGHRMRRTVLPPNGVPASAMGFPSHFAGLNNTDPRVRLGGTTPGIPPGTSARQLFRASLGSSRQPRQDGSNPSDPAPAAAEANGAEPTGRGRREGRSNHPRRRRLYHEQVITPEVPEGVNPVNAQAHAIMESQLTHFISVSRNRMGRLTRSEAEQRFNEYMNEQQDAMAADGPHSATRDTRRFIRLAVDTATAEVLRRHQANASQGVIANVPSVQSAIESRIERVLNERGNRGLSPVSPTNFTADPNGPRQRPEELHQMRIDVLAAISRHRAAMSTSGTQTPRSFLRAGSGNPTAESSSSPTEPAAEPQPDSAPPPTFFLQPPQPIPPPTGMDFTPIYTGPRPLTMSRRRPYSRLSRPEGGSGETNSDDESTPPLPPRIARMSLVPGSDSEARTNALIEQITSNINPYVPPSGSGQELPGSANPIPNEVGLPPPMPNPPPRYPSPSGSAASGYQFMPFGEHWVIRRQRLMNQQLTQVLRSHGHNQIGFASRRVDHQPNPAVPAAAAQPHHPGPGSVSPSAWAADTTEGSARTRVIPNGNGLQHSFTQPERDANAEDEAPASAASSAQRMLPPLRRHYMAYHNQIQNPAPNNNGANPPNPNADEVPVPQPTDASARFYPGYIPEILITPRARPPTYYTMDAATTAFLSSRIQKWDFSEFILPDITKRDESVVVRECSLHSDACLDVSSDSDFLAVLQPSDNGQYSAVGLYSLRDESLGGILYIYHFDQNTVSVSISPSCDYIVVGYAGRGPFYRFVHPSRNIGQILSLTRDGERMKLVSVKELFADSQSSLMSINCMHWVPVPGYGIIYGTNTGELVLLS